MRVLPTINSDGTSSSIQRQPRTLLFLRNPPHPIPPRSACDYPEEAQIAAAALVVHSNNPTAALTALMEVALAARQHPAISGT